MKSGILRCFIAQRLLTKGNEADRLHGRDFKHPSEAVDTRHDWFAQGPDK